MFYLFVLAHLVADFVLQPLWLVQRKRYWDGLLIHGGIVLACMLLLSLLEAATLRLWPAMLGITAVHVAADWWKVRQGDRLFRRPILPFLLDQVIHLATIATVLSLVLPAPQVWGLAASPAASPALYALVYVVAAFAAPIGVMIWLDPAFAHAMQAGRARVRSLFAGAVVISLVLFVGTLALPATLFGLVWATRRPASSHPLDMPTGMLAVLCVAATLGAALRLMR